MKLPGLQVMRETAKPGTCPFCGDPVKPRTRGAGRPPSTCGDDVCTITAYNRYYQRDHRRMKRGKKPLTTR